MKEGTKVALGGWEGIAEARSGYLVQGAAAVTLASTGEGSGRKLAVSENVGLTRAAAERVTAQLCQASSERLSAELLGMEMAGVKKRARAVGVLEPSIAQETNKAGLVEKVVEKCWLEALMGLEGTEEETAAAARLQAIQRGKLDRKKVAGLKIEKEMGLSGTEEEQQVIAKVQAAQRGKIARKEVEGLKIEKGLGLEGAQEETDAIAKMQAVQRGKNARKEVDLFTTRV